MSRVIQVVLIALILSSLASISYAEWLARDYKKLKESEPMLIYVEGIGKGLVYASAIMKYETGKSLFCLPDKLVLETANFIRILDDKIEREETSVGFQKAQEVPIEMLLLSGLVNTFPCVKSNEEKGNGNPKKKEYRKTK